ncbi:MAG: Uroporphyrinogen decarboxylase (URO-D) [Planctomycetes bacterium ADurb.Bin126]|nr:MAG: Uroporphyrinogen decarboxylase (URO-D) [Planctomycetes bacterium ADurb.Bin126]HOD82375.1 uroporphyrinogen decarboxylase family protein [Phycisphaerae bacterium]HQL73428.1 uroporphyrinogen decarboxylase family protein [Phycisphaerae bacterium]
MNHVERFRAVMEFQAVDRLPRWEWAMWWDETIARWRGEGLPANLESVFDISAYFGLDPYQQYWFSTTENVIEAAQHHVEGIVSDMDDYLRLRPRFFPDHSHAIRTMAPWARRQAEGEAVVWITLEGFFWFPRTLMGFTKLMLAFYDQPELLHRINGDLLEFNLALLDQIEKVCVPTFMTVAEDMSYNNGPMISQATFEEFVAPYYRRLLERVRNMPGKKIWTIVDTDGDVTLLVPWLQDVGVDGVLPLERQAGVDGMALRERFPTFRMIGHYDKMVMNKGEPAMRAEFERLLPLCRSGGFIPSVDHQTPPGVSLAEYRCYRRLLDEYTTPRNGHRPPERKDHP